MAALGIGACGGDEPSVDAASLDLRGTRIDGSEDGAAPLATAVEEIPSAAAEAAEDAADRPAVEAAAVEGSEDAPAAASDDDPVDDDTPATPTSEPEVDEAPDDEEAGVEEPDEAAPDDEAPARDENAELGHLRDDGVRELTFQDLSLEGIDYELLVDSLLFPEEYGEDGVELPKNVAALSGQEVSVQGYMIPGKIARGGNVRDFMLVRDLLACCFGGIPKPDEWIDVVMAEDAEAEYVRYMPLVVTGTLTVGEDMDMDAFNPAVFKMVGTEVRRRE